MENYKDEIIASRVGYLGSSDAKMVCKIGRTQKLSYTDQERLGVMLGQCPQREYTNAAMENGDFVEQCIYQDFLSAYPQALSNPLTVSSRKFGGFGLLDHIDIEVLKDDALIWYEIKASRYSTDQVRDEYDEQLRWHYMMLTEKAAALGRKAQLYLVHYPVETYGEYDPSKVLVMPVSFKGDYAAQIEAGLQFIADTIASGWEYTPKDVMATSDLPAEIASKVEYIKQTIADVEAKKAEIEAFKETLLDLCLQHGVTSIAGEGWSATVRQGYTSQRVDSKKLQAQHPDIYEECLTTTNNKPSITIKVK